MGRAALEPKIAEEIEEYIKHFIKPNHDRPIDMTVSLPQATANIISQLIFDQRFEYTDIKFNQLISTINDIIKLVQKLGLTAGIPFNRILFKSWHEYGEKLFKIQAALFDEMVSQKRDVLDIENPQGVIDHYLIHSLTEEGKNDYCFAGIVI